MRRWTVGIVLALVVTMALAVSGYYLVSSRSFQLTGRLVERVDGEIRRTGYRGPITFRPPYGKKLWTLPRYLSRHDRTTVMWDVETHVMYEGRAASRAPIPRIVEQLRADGYRFVSVSDLIAR